MHFQNILLNNFSCLLKLASHSISLNYLNSELCIQYLFHISLCIFLHYHFLFDSSTYTKLCSLEFWILKYCIFRNEICSILEDNCSWSFGINIEETKCLKETTSIELGFHKFIFIIFSDPMSFSYLSIVQNCCTFTY